jgi:hypothetical protein
VIVPSYYSNLLRVQETGGRQRNGDTGEKVSENLVSIGHGREGHCRTLRIDQFDTRGRIVSIRAQEVFEP